VVSYKNALQVHGADGGGNIRITNDTTGAGTGNGFEAVVVGIDAYLIQREAAPLIFYTSGAEAMRIDSSGNVGIGVSNPSSYQGNADNLVVGNLVDAGTGITIVSGTASLGSIHFADSPTGDDSYRGFIQYDHVSNFMRFATNATERMRIDSSGNVGIGVVPPTDAHATWSQLFLGEKGSYISEKSNSGGIYGNFVTDNLYIDADTGAFANITTDQSSAYRQEAGVHHWYSQASGSAGAAVTLSEKMTINSSGNVGIGTSSPSSLLDVDQSQNDETNIELTNTNTGSSAQVRTKYTTDGGLFTVGKTSDAHAFGGDAYLYNVDNTNIRFATNDTERMRISSSGNVGIGDLGNAATLLHIGSTGTPEFRLQDLDAGGGYLSVTHNAGTSTISADPSNSSGSPTLVFKTVNSEAMRIDSSGNLLVGTTAKLNYNAGGTYKNLSIDGGTGTDNRAEISLAGGGGGANYNLGRINFGLSSNTTNAAAGINGYSSAAGASTGGVLAFSTASDISVGSYSERMRIDSNGALLLKNTVSTGLASGDIALANASSIRSRNAANSAYLNIMYLNASNELILGGGGAVAGIEFGISGIGAVGKFDSSGNLLVGTTVSPATLLTDGYSGFAVNGTNDYIVSSRFNDTAAYFKRENSDGPVVAFYRDGTSVGTISVTASATSYNTSSDYRLKTDAQPMTGASARVLALKPVNFAWIVDGSRVDGFLAHEAQAVVPECVTGTKDAMRDEEYEVTAAVYEDIIIAAVLDEEGNELEAERTEQRLVTEAVMGTRSVPDMQGIDQSKLVPLLTAALQEALTKIADMEIRLSALEG
jgi:hypothetical protein